MLDICHCKLKDLANSKERKWFVIYYIHISQHDQNIDVVPSRVGGRVGRVDRVGIGEGDGVNGDVASEDAVVGEHDEKFVRHPCNYGIGEISIKCRGERDLINRI